MIPLILKGLAAGAVVVTISELASRVPRLAALILFVPLAVPMVFILMYLKQPAVAPISSLARQSLLLIPLSLPLFVPLALADRWGWSFWAALVIGLLLLAGTIGTYLWISAG